MARESYRCGIAYGTLRIRWLRFATVISIIFFIVGEAFLGRCAPLSTQTYWAGRGIEVSWETDGRRTNCYSWASANSLKRKPSNARQVAKRRDSLVSLQLKSSNRKDVCSHHPVFTMKITYGFQVKLHLREIYDRLLPTHRMRISQQFRARFFLLRLEILSSE